MKNILLGVTGGIAAYKSANIISILRKRGYNVKVIMTTSATKIITPQTLETLSRNKVYTDMWEREHQMEVEHISLAEWADLILVAPATLNIIGKVANGIADDMLSTVISASIKPVYFALAMNVNMYNNPILKSNIDKLKSFNYNFIEADEGFLACNVNAKGRLKDEKEIVEIIEERLEQEESQPLKNINFLITAGRTEEALDPVRYFSNRSSGQMGYELAKRATLLGANVTLISGPTNLEVPNNLKKFISVKSAQNMFDKVMEEFDSQDVAIACAAVADYRPKIYSTEKIKKADGDLVIALERNPDILFNMGLKKENQFLIGFAAETENIEENAKKKLMKKNLNMIVANNANNMQKQTNSIQIIKNNGEIVKYPEKSKKEVAKDIINELIKEYDFSIL
ncbi:bifunctional phosphopantothenoylcysteine decarboxylase/phosphopantothenate--cysteine ligase CoaBC [uncultured Cetobacterium sp.]|uniref:bifunctional phosphopantothenoylcysteine decarboxylase/phosphopantothenate--cysteine ligase CoaBC n=1 Tax=uncultured Cetobacterium sp. TaxID=527638 RepID=UPI00263A203A|nr:bifunctional phosphopantothenoylcysteine decarboxylase/phosphopantothenate--cysteine ligase CoaBC [uncultured Cetobacterium sp.]